ncbi:hypothetical protein M8P87_19650, partial [Pseudomonas stutzeri]|uniref:hypothetical protein n=1 Tax=Stutzerimonas stutzeri TaxID=316 RepID=UPI00210E5748
SGSLHHGSKSFDIKGLMPKTAVNVPALPGNPTLRTLCVLSKRGNKSASIRTQNGSAMGCRNQKVAIQPGSIVTNNV